MKKLIMCGITLFGLTWTLQSAVAVDVKSHQFTVVNKSSLYIAEIRVSEGNNKRWRSDILGQDALADGESVSIDFEYVPGNCMRSLKVVYGDHEAAGRNDGKYDVFEKVDLCRLKSLTIDVDENARQTVPSWDYESR